MRRLILATLLAVMAAAQSATAADALPYGSSLSFAAFRNGQQIGHHTVTFELHGSEITASTSVDFAVEMLGIVVYRYQHRGQETWNGNTFVGLSSETDDNGKKYRVEVIRDAAGLKVVRVPRTSAIQASTAYVGFRPSEMVEEIVPAQLMPSTQWNLRQVRQSSLISPQYGTQAHVQVAPVGRETIRTATGSLQAVRYRYSGDLRMDQWFDDSDRWVKASFIAHDGSTVEYILQE